MRTLYIRDEDQCEQHTLEQERLNKKRAPEAWGGLMLDHGFGVDGNTDV